MGSDLRRRAVERILEDESLTADLVDEAATLLLDWGLARAEKAAQERHHLSLWKLDACIIGLKHTMAWVNDVVAEEPPQEQAERLRALLSQFERAPTMESDREADHED